MSLELQESWGINHLYKKLVLVLDTITAQKDFLKPSLTLPWSRVLLFSCCHQFPGAKPGISLCFSSQGNCREQSCHLSTSFSPENSCNLEEKKPDPSNHKQNFSCQYLSGRVTSLQPGKEQFLFPALWLGSGEKNHFFVRMENAEQQDIILLVRVMDIDKK